MLLTISQLAKYVGVTARAVRHYHALGLLPEPPRDGSGYRRYGADAVVALYRIKTLADAGIPLAQIEVLVRASEQTLTAAISSIKAAIAERIAELETAKLRLDALRAGDRMFLSEPVVQYLDFLRQIGLSETMVLHERDAWILVSALYPDNVEMWVKEKQAMLATPDVKSLYLRLDEARSWSSNDPRIVELAKHMVRLAGTDPTATGRDRLASDKRASSIVDQFGLNEIPSLRRLREVLIELVRCQ